MKVSNINDYKAVRRSLQNINFGKIFIKIVVVFIIFNSIFTITIKGNIAHAQEKVIKRFNSIEYIRHYNNRNCLSSDTYKIIEDDGNVYFIWEVFFLEEAVDSAFSHWTKVTHNGFNIDNIKREYMNFNISNDNRSMKFKIPLYKMDIGKKITKFNNQLNDHNYWGLVAKYKNGIEAEVGFGLQKDIEIQKEWWNSQPTIAITKPNGNEYFV